jgi:hypothetical protein
MMPKIKIMMMNKLLSMNLKNLEKKHKFVMICTSGKRPYDPGSSGPLVPVAEPGSITWDQCWSWFQHEPGPIGLHVDVLQREGAWILVPVRSTNRDR